VVLERFEFDISSTSFPLVHGWIYKTLRTITSPAFNEFVIWLPDEGIPWNPVNSAGWKAVDASLNVLAERNPGFRVAFRVAFPSFSYDTRCTWCTYVGVPPFVVNYLPLVSSKGLVKFEHVHIPHVENRFGKFGFL